MNNLPEVIENLVNAQNTYDSDAFTECFAESAVVYDEGHQFKGKSEIKSWIEGANEAFKTVMKPIEYLEDNQKLKAEISGNFPGSPLVLVYQFVIKSDQIHSLRIV